MVQHIVKGLVCNGSIFNFTNVQTVDASHSMWSLWKKKKKKIRKWSCTPFGGLYYFFFCQRKNDDINWHNKHFVDPRWDDIKIISKLHSRFIGNLCHDNDYYLTGSIIKIFYLIPLSNY